jgi:hypothetical protein
VKGASVQGGAQVEIAIKYQLFADNWWFGVNDDPSGPWIWLGYYPASLFNGGVGANAAQVTFGGEVASTLTDPCQTQDQMGSGLQASTGWTHAAYQRNLRYQSDANGTMATLNGLPEVDAAALNCATNPYTIQPFMKSATSWDSYQCYGGPAPHLGALFQSESSGSSPSLTVFGKELWVAFLSHDTHQAILVCSSTSPADSQL